MAHDFRRAAISMPGVDRHLRWVQPSRGHPGGQDRPAPYRALTTSDNIMTFRTVIGGSPMNQNIYATFMPKGSSAEHPGSGITTMSLFEGDAARLLQGRNAYQLSAVARRFVAGILQQAQRDHRGDQSVGQLLSKRLWGGGGASLSDIGATTTPPPCCVSDVQATQGPSSPGRSAFRSLPHRCLARTYRAARRRSEGASKGPDLPPETEGTYGRSPMASAALSASSRCRVLHGRSRSERSELVAETLGERLRRFFLRNRSARNGRTTGARSRPTSWSATCPRL